jgi:hypothetical protein
MRHDGIWSRMLSVCWRFAGRDCTANVMEPSPSTILQCIQRDVVMAWSEFSPKAELELKERGTRTAR